jgi:hypothetical protein
MDFFEDLFKGRHLRQDDRYHDLHPQGKDLIRSGITHILRSKAVLFSLVIGLVFIIAIFLGLFLLILPLVYKLFSYINQNGIKAIYDLIGAFIFRLWEGGGKG